jgi:hypothetical protein
MWLIAVENKEINISYRRTFRIDRKELLFFEVKLEELLKKLCKTCHVPVEFCRVFEICLVTYSL